MYVHTYGTWQVFSIENWNTVQFFNIFYFLFNGEFGIWIIYLLAEFRMQIHTEFRGILRNFGNFYCKKYRGIPQNSAEFRGIPYVFQKILYSVGSQKHTSVDTLALRQVWLQPSLTGDFLRLTCFFRRVPSVKCGWSLPSMEDLLRVTYMYMSNKCRCRWLQ